MLLLRLGTEVDWSAEKTCLSGIMDELARFYACIRVDAIVRDQKEDDQAQGQDETEKGWWSEHRGPGMGTVPERDVHHILVPALRTCSLPPDVVAAAFVRLASLPELYKVFERC
ncbi:hypothetical protein BC828DRAFT_407869 [Blastocladiella britannica]|nr:hypothetical protein BC828DRAFT_407869 [Blastocladiella britannica]